MVNSASKQELLILTTKYIGDEDPYYDTKISIFSFTWAGLAAFFSSDKI